MSWTNLLYQKIGDAQVVFGDLVIESYKPGQRRLYRANRKVGVSGLSPISDFMTFREMWEWLNGFMAGAKFAPAPDLLTACEAVAAANAYGNDVPNWYEDDGAWIINTGAARLVAQAIAKAKLGDQSEQG